MKKKFLLTLTGIATPILTVAPLTMVACGGTTTEDEGEIVTPSASDITKVTGAGETKVTFTFTLKETFLAGAKLKAETTGSSTSITPRVLSTTASGTTVTTVVGIYTSKTGGLQQGDSTTFKLTYTYEDASCNKQWTQTIENCKITYTAPVNLNGDKSVIAPAGEASYSYSLTAVDALDVVPTVTIERKQSSSGCSPTLGTVTKSDKVITVPITINKSTELLNGDWASFNITLTYATTTKTWTQTITDLTLVYATPLYTVDTEFTNDEGETQAWVWLDYLGTKSLSADKFTITSSEITVGTPVYVNKQVGIPVTPTSTTGTTFSLTINYQDTATATNWTQTISGLKAILCESTTAGATPKSMFNIVGSELLGFSSSAELNDDYSVLLIPNSVKKIADNAFDNQITSSRHSSINTIKVNQYLYDIGTDAFNRCTGITKFDASDWTDIPTWKDSSVFKSLNQSSGTILTNSSINEDTIEFLCDKLPFCFTGESYMQTYISDRTFSLAGYCNGYFCFGTGWVIDDATPTVTDDYTYWIGTNWHVTHGIETLGDEEDITHLYADKSMKDSSYQFIDYENYKKVGSYDCEADSKFLYDTTHKTYFKKGIDFHVTKINFGEASKLSSDVKAKLDKLNRKKAKQGYITKFAEATDSIPDTKYFIGGYPMKEDSSGYHFGGQWETHEVNVNWEYTSYNDEDAMHSIGDPDRDIDGSRISGGTEQFYYYDIAPQFLSNTNKGTSWMTGGASGSMLINQDYEIAAIYWGGWGGTSTFYPAFSQFNSTTKNFVADYLN